jgi:predicted nuclease of predicted toxin-antitoxin system
VPSKKQSNISQRGRRPKTRFFLDRNLGSFLLPAQLRRAGLNTTIHDDLYVQTERDPWIFYECGRAGFVVLTSDTEFMKSFTHMAAIAVARTTVLAFSNNNYKSEVRGNAFLAALPKINKELSKRRTRQKNKYFIGIIGMHGTLAIRAESPLPHRKRCDSRDWESYERVCAAEGLLAFRAEDDLDSNT